MGLLSDALRHLLATDATERRAGLAGLAGRMFGVEPVGVGHRAIQEDLAFDLVHYPKTALRTWAVTMTLGLAETWGRELVAFTLADVRDPHDDRIAWMLVSAQDAVVGRVVALPEGCLGRSSHTHALVTEPWLFSPRDRLDYERIVGARLDLVVPITEREAAFVNVSGADRFVGAMHDQGIAPYADRPAGETRLPS